MTAAEHVANNLDGCTCGGEYKSRQLIAPDCPWCHNSKALEQSHKDYAREVAEAVRNECITMAKRVHGTGPSFDIGAFKTIDIEQFIK